MLVKAYMDTYKFPANITNCSNNYGPYQFPEKLIPLMIHNALEGKALPVYGNGRNVRDWLYVEDHAKASHIVSSIFLFHHPYHTLLAELVFFALISKVFYNNYQRWHNKYLSTDPFIYLTCYWYSFI